MWDQLGADCRKKGSKMAWKKGKVVVAVKAKYYNLQVFVKLDKRSEQLVGNGEDGRQQNLPAPTKILIVSVRALTKAILIVSANQINALTVGILVVAVQKLGHLLLFCGRLVAGIRIVLIALLQVSVGTFCA